MKLFVASSTTPIVSTTQISIATKIKNLDTGFMFFYRLTLKLSTQATKNINAVNKPVYKLLYCTP